MKTLYLSLVDYDMVLLKGIAQRRAIPLTTANQTQAVEQLAESLLSPAAVAIALDDLSAEEQTALELLLSHGGQLEAPRFAREFGFIRPMGPARLDREKPWLQPVNAAEGLWYRGFIFKAFQMAAQGGREMVYLPTDLIPLLNLSTLTQETPLLPPDPAWQIDHLPPPAKIINTTGRLRENFFNLLVYLQTTPIRLEPGLPHTDAFYPRLSPRDKQLLLDLLLPSLWPNEPFTPAAELEFLLHLGQRTGLLTLKHGRLRPDRDPIRAWLQKPYHEQLRQLQNGWRADPTWNDLWHVPGLLPQPTGWENSPLLARSKILGFLARLDASTEDWLALNDFVAAIKTHEPDFQRPNADYESWYIYDTQGQLLMGFEHWDQVEGALIHYLLLYLLPLLEVVELGTASETGQPNHFRLTLPGRAFLQGDPPPPAAAKQPPLLRVDANFYAHAPAQASLYDRFQLARFAQLERREAERTVYHITQDSVKRALRNGVAAEQITTFLARATNNQTPLKVVETLLTWGARQNTARLEQATLLRLANESLADELRQHPTLGPLLGESLGSTTLIIPSARVAEVRRLLVELGYLEQ